LLPQFGQFQSSLVELFLCGFSQFQFGHFIAQVGGICLEPGLGGIEEMEMGGDDDPDFAFGLGPGVREWGGYLLEAGPSEHLHVVVPGR
jgi:hypothetical protein